MGYAVLEYFCRPARHGAEAQVQIVLLGDETEVATQRQQGDMHCQFDQHNQSELFWPTLANIP